MIKKKVTTLFLCLTLLCNLCTLPQLHAFANKDTQNNSALSSIKKINCYNDLVEACALGGTYMLTDSIVLKNSITIPSNVSLTILQEPGKEHSISSDESLDNLFYVKSTAELTLGSASLEPVILNGNNITDYGSTILSLGTLHIKNASITCPNGRGIVCNTIFIEKGKFDSCKYEGISVYSNGTILNGSFSNCKCGIFVHPESSVTIQDGEYTNNQTGVYAKGICTIYGGVFSNCEYTLQSSSYGSIYFTGGVISNADCWALDVSNGGSIHFSGGEIYNSRSTTYPAPDKNIQGALYLGGSPYMDQSSFIYCRTGSPVIQTSSLTAPNDHPDAKLQIAAYSTDTPAIITASNDIQIEKDWYVPYDNSYEFVVIDNKLYAQGLVSNYNGQLPTIRPDTTPRSQEETAVVTTPAVTCPLDRNTLEPQNSIPVQTPPPVSSKEPDRSVAAEEVIYSVLTPSPTNNANSSLTPSCIPTQCPDSLPKLDYSNFVRTTPTITKVTSKGLNFYLTWNFNCILSPDKYKIYYSTDRKHFTLKKTVKGSQTTTSLYIPKAFNGKRIYFRIVATISGENTIYESKKSNIVSKYLLSKVTGICVSYHTDSDKLKITWRKNTNCTGYCIYIKAKSNGITSVKKCATVSNSNQMTSISSAKIKRLFSRNGKSVHIKKCYVRAYFKSSSKIAYSP